MDARAYAEGTVRDCAEGQPWVARYVREWCLHGGRCARVLHLVWLPVGREYRSLRPHRGHKEWCYHATQAALHASLSTAAGESAVQPGWLKRSCDYQERQEKFHTFVEAQRHESAALCAVVLARCAVSPDPAQLKRAKHKLSLRRAQRRAMARALGYN